MPRHRINARTLGICLSSAAPASLIVTRHSVKQRVVAMRDGPTQRANALFGWRPLGCDLRASRRHPRLVPRQQARLRRQQRSRRGRIEFDIYRPG